VSSGSVLKKYQLLIFIIFDKLLRDYKLHGEYITFLKHLENAVAVSSLQG